MSENKNKTWEPVLHDDECVQFDGKRCRLMGFQPDRFCEPWVKAAAKLLGEFVEGLAQDYTIGTLRQIGERAYAIRHGVVKCEVLEVER